jgi:hypothetical protein
MGKISQTKARVLDQFEARTDDWSFHDFERVLEQAMGKSYGNYQTAKMTILEAERSGRWPRTVKRYVESNLRAFGNLPVELNPIGTKLARKDQHVIPTPGGWAVRSTGSERASRVFATREDAVEHATQLAKKDKAELYVHKTDGTIQSRAIYSNDFLRPNNKK